MHMVTGSPDQEQGPEAGGDEEVLKRLYRPEGYAEIASRTSPREVRHFTRMFCALTIEGLWYESEQQPNDWLINNSIIPQLRDRAHQMRIDLPLGLSYPTEDDAQAKLTADLGPSVNDLLEREAEFLETRGRFLEAQERRKRKISPEDVSKAEERRERLAEAYEAAAREVKARATLTAKLAEQDVFAGDIEQYMRNAFERLGKLRADTRHYAEILNLPPTHEDFEGYGKKVQKAFKMWRDVAEGRAVVGIKITKEDGTESVEPRTLPNPFAMPRNHGLMEMIIDKYVVPNLGLNSLPATSGAAKAKRELEMFDNKAAAITALMFFRHWDLDAYNQLGVEGYSRNIDLKALTPEDLEILDLELAWADSGKAIHFEPRRAAEFRGRPGAKKGERRPHPRRAGSPSSLGCYPMLSTHALDIMSCEVVATNKANPFERQIVKVSVEQRVFGKGEVKRPREKENQFGKKGEEVDWVFETTNLGDRSIWDNITVLEEGDVAEIVPATTPELTEDEVGKVKKTVDLAMGTQSDAFEIPYKLQGYYAYKFLFAQITRTDYSKLLDEVLEGDLLRKMNKGIDLALGIMSTGQNIGKKTMGKLNEYVRIVFLGSLAASVIKPVGKESVPVGASIENKTQVPFSASKQSIIIQGIKNAALTTSFVKTVEEPGKSLRWADQKHHDLLDKIIEKREAPSPFEVNGWVEGEWFTPEELERLRPLYPLEIESKGK